ncbi:GumC family protein [Roseibium sp.]|uniref:GumC family protein n=1 Tax=Roseibium sp. TaxID=1936156 RepID=UPI003BA9C6DA
MEQSFDLGAIVSIAKRRFLYFLIPVVVVFGIAVTVAYLLPKSYEAKATILIESQRIPSQLALTTVTADSSERLKVIEQRLLARDNLLSIASQFELYRDDGVTPSPSVIVENMRGAIQINQISVSRSRRGTQVVGFDVAFRYTSATTAARVANQLVNSILSQNIETRLSRAAETGEFFQQQLRDLEGELATKESEMAEFKRVNESALPETLGIRREKLAQIDANLEAIAAQLRLINESDGTQQVPQESDTQGLAFQLQSLELNHEAFTERRELLAPLLEKGFVSQRTMDDLERSIAQTEIQIASVKSQMSQQGFTADPGTRVKLLESQQVALQKRADDLRDSIFKTPGVEVELSAMVRDYENLRSEYSQTKAKLTDAEIGERLEQDRQAERFEVLEQATVPEQPAAPNRIQIVAAGGGGAIAVGAALVLLLEFLDNSIRTAKDLERRLKLRPIAVIPYVTTRKERIRKITRRVLTLLIILAAIVAALAIVHFYVTPIDLLVERTVTKVQPFLPSFLLP